MVELLLLEEAEGCPDLVVLVGVVGFPGVFLLVYFPVVFLLEVAPLEDFLVVVGSLAVQQAVVLLVVSLRHPQLQEDTNLNTHHYSPNFHHHTVPLLPLQHFHIDSAQSHLP